MADADSGTAGEPALGLVIGMEAGPEGDWQIRIDGSRALLVPLRPVELVVRLRRPANERVLIGQVSLSGTDQWVPFRVSEQIVGVLREWLLAEPGE